MDAYLEDTNDHSKASLRLLMYTSMPSHESSWVAGFESATNNIPIDENPFSESDLEYKCWENGWWSGFYGEDFLVSDFLFELHDYKQK